MDCCSNQWLVWTETGDLVCDYCGAEKLVCDYCGAEKTDS